MRSKLLPLACALCAAGLAHAQQQEEGMTRIFSAVDRARNAINESATNPKAKIDPSLSSSLGSKAFNAGAFDTKTFKTAGFNGTKTAEMKTFETRSFLGIKNPWFGKKVFTTEDAKFDKQTAAEAKEKFETDSYAVKKFTDSSKANAEIAGQQVPSNSAPRTYFGPEPSKSMGLEQFTKNVHRDLSIDEVRDLLNKGKQAK